MILGQITTIIVALLAIIYWLNQEGCLPFLMICWTLYVAIYGSIQMWQQFG